MTEKKIDILNGLFKNEDIAVVDLYGDSKPEIAKNLGLINKKKFKTIIETMMIEQNLNIVDSITEYCEQQMIDIEDVIPHLDNDLKNKIKDYAHSRNLVKGHRDSCLPF